MTWFIYYWSFPCLTGLCPLTLSLFSPLLFCLLCMTIVSGASYPISWSWPAISHIITNMTPLFYWSGILSSYGMCSVVCILCLTEFVSVNMFSRCPVSLTNCTKVLFCHYWCLLEMPWVSCSLPACLCHSHFVRVTIVVCSIALYIYPHGFTVHHLHNVPFAQLQ